MLRFLSSLLVKGPIHLFSSCENNQIGPLAGVDDFLYAYIQNIENNLVIIYILHQTTFCF